MPLKKVPEWPRVLKDDDGLRPTAGSPDHCFYCDQAVGDFHGPECVTILKLVRYQVYMNLDDRAQPGQLGRLISTWDHHDPHFWNAYDCEFHKNDSSWCADNALDEIQMTAEDRAALEKWMEQDDNCACRPLHFEFDCVLDDGPFITVPEEK